MIITICSSMRFLDKMAEAEEKLKSMGHKVLVPKGLIMVRETNWRPPKTAAGRVKGKLKYNFIKEHFEKIEEADAILVLNFDKDEHENYIGPNTLLEMGIAYWLGKKIFLLNPVPRFYCWEEIKAMKPMILNGELEKIR